MVKEIENQEYIIKYINWEFRKMYKKYSTEFDFSHDVNDVINNNANFIDILKMSIKENFEEMSNFQELDYPEWLREVDHRDPMGELINFIKEFKQIHSFSLDDRSNELKEMIITEIESSYSILSKDEIDELYKYNDDEYNKAIEACYLIGNNTNADYYLHKKEEFEHMLKLLNLLDFRSLTCVYRTSFINICSIFDALVFDVFKRYFVLNIEKLEQFFDKKKCDLFSFEELSSCNSIAELHKAMVDKRFDGIYIREIMRLLEKYNENFFDSNFKFIEVEEILKRRNIHVHNNGVVDSKYLESGNIFSFDVGEFAEIDEVYFYRCIRCFLEFFNRFNSQFQ